MKYIVGEGLKPSLPLRSLCVLGVFAVNFHLFVELLTTLVDYATLLTIDR